MFVHCVFAILCLLRVTSSESRELAIDNCSDKCNNVSAVENFKYEIGRSYIYRYENSIDLLWNGTGPETSFEALVTLTKISQCQFYLKFSDVSFRNIPNSSHLSDSLTKNGLKFNMENGRITSLCPSSVDSASVIKIKEAFLSMLQVSITKISGYRFVRESDIFGDCPTHYSATMNTNGDDLIVRKRKYLAQCRSRFNFFAIYSSMLSDWRNDCVQQISSSKIVTKVKCSETNVNTLYQRRINSTVHLRDVRVASIKIDGTAWNGDYRIGTIVNWNNEIEIENDIFRSSVSNLCRHLGYRDFSHQTAGKELIELKRIINGVDYKTLKNVLIRNEIDDELCNWRSVNKLIIEALIAEPSAAGMRIIFSDLTDDKRLADDKLQMFFLSMSFKQYVDVEFISAIEQLLRIGKLSPVSSVFSVCSVLRTYLQTSSINEIEVQNIIDSLRVGLEATTVGRTVLLRSLGSLSALGQSRNFVLDWSTGKSSIADHESRVSAISLLEKTESCDHNVHRTMRDMMLDTSEKLEIRLSAYRTFVACIDRNETDFVVSLIDENSSQDVEFKNYIRQHLINVKRSINPAHGRLRDLFFFFKIDSGLSVSTTSSRNFQLNIREPMVFTEIDVMTEKTELIPSFIRVNFSTLTASGDEIIIAEFGIRQHGFNNKLPAEGQRLALQMMTILSGGENRNLTRQLYDIWTQLSIMLNEICDEQCLSMYLTINGRMINYWTHPKRENQLDIDIILKYIFQFFNTQTITIGDTFSIRDIRETFMSLSGFPLIESWTTVFLRSYKFHQQLNSNNRWTFDSSFTFETLCSAELQLDQTPNSINGLIESRMVINSNIAAIVGLTETRTERRTTSIYELELPSKTVILSVQTLMLMKNFNSTDFSPIGGKKTREMCTPYFGSLAICVKKNWLKEFELTLRKRDQAAMKMTILSEHVSADDLRSLDMPFIKDSNRPEMLSPYDDDVGKRLNITRKLIDIRCSETQLRMNGYEFLVDDGSRLINNITFKYDENRRFNGFLIAVSDVTYLRYAKYFLRQSNPIGSPAFNLITNINHRSVGQESFWKVRVLSEKTAFIPQYDIGKILKSPITSERHFMSIIDDEPDYIERDQRLISELIAFVIQFPSHLISKSRKTLSSLLENGENTVYQLNLNVSNRLFTHRSEYSSRPQSRAIDSETLYNEKIIYRLGSLCNGHRENQYCKCYMKIGERFDFWREKEINPSAIDSLGNLTIVNGENKLIIHYNYNEQLNTSKDIRHSRGGVIKFGINFGAINLTSMLRIGDNNFGQIEHNTSVNVDFQLRNINEIFAQLNKSINFTADLSRHMISNESSTSQQWTLHYNHRPIVKTLLVMRADNITLSEFFIVDFESIIGDVSVNINRIFGVVKVVQGSLSVGQFRSEYGYFLGGDTLSVNIDTKRLSENFQLTLSRTKFNDDSIQVRFEQRLKSIIGRLQSIGTFNVSNDILSGPHNIQMSINSETMNHDIHLKYSVLNGSLLSSMAVRKGNKQIFDVKLTGNGQINGNESSFILLRSSFKSSLSTLNNVQCKLQYEKKSHSKHLELKAMKDEKILHRVNFFTDPNRTVIELQTRVMKIDYESLPNNLITKSQRRFSLVHTNTSGEKRVLIRLDQIGNKLRVQSFHPFDYSNSLVIFRLPMYIKYRARSIRHSKLTFGVDKFNLNISISEKEPKKRDIGKIRNGPLEPILMRLTVGYGNQILTLVSGSFDGNEALYELKTPQLTNSSLKLDTQNGRLRKISTNTCSNVNCLHVDFSKFSPQYWPRKSDMTLIVGRIQYATMNIHFLTNDTVDNQKILASLSGRRFGYELTRKSLKQVNSVDLSIVVPSRIVRLLLNTDQLLNKGKIDIWSNYHRQSPNRLTIDFNHQFWQNGKKNDSLLIYKLSHRSLLNVIQFEVKHTYDNEATHLLSKLSLTDDEKNDIITKFNHTNDGTMITISAQLYVRDQSFDAGCWLTGRKYTENRFTGNLTCTTQRDTDERPVKIERTADLTLKINDNNMDENRSLTRMINAVGNLTTNFLPKSISFVYNGSRSTENESILNLTKYCNNLRITGNDESGHLIIDQCVDFKSISGKRLVKFSIDNTFTDNGKCVEFNLSRVEHKPDDFAVDLMVSTTLINGIISELGSARITTLRESFPAYIVDPLTPIVIRSLSPLMNAISMEINTIINELKSVNDILRTQLGVKTLNTGHHLTRRVAKNNNDQDDDQIIVKALRMRHNDIDTLIYDIENGEISAIIRNNNAIDKIRHLIKIITAELGMSTQL